ncbi:putative ATPase, V1 complex, subunit F [Arabidopsis thaliana]
MAGRATIPARNSALIAMIADEDTVVGFLMAGVGNVDIRRKTNYLIVDSKTTVRQIEDAFKEFSARDDIAIILLSQYVSVFFQIQFTCNVTHLNCYVCTVLFKS